jgi:heme-degrading monooxygenase HmoA
MFVVIVLFEPAPERVEENLAAVREAVDRIVARQPGFRRARIHRGIAPTADMVVNYMEWDSAEAFHAFRARHGEEVGALVGPFGPRFTFHEIAAETAGPAADRAA